MWHGFCRSADYREIERVGEVLDRFHPIGVGMANSPNIHRVNWGAETARNQIVDHRASDRPRMIGSPDDHDAVRPNDRFEISGRHVSHQLL